MKQQTLIVTLAVLALFALTGCGANKIEETGPLTGSLNSSSTTAPTTAVAKCSHDVSNQSELSTRLKVYEDGYTGTRADLIRVKFNRFPTTFGNADTSAIQLWTRTIDSSGNWGSWRKVSFYVEKYSSAGVVRSPYLYSDITWAQLKLLAAHFGISFTNAADFFGQVTLLAQLTDTNASKVLTAKLYMDSTSPEVTALIPTFAANPRTYAASRPAALYAFHPLQALANSGYTNDQYVYESNQFCF